MKKKLAVKANPLIIIGGAEGIEPLTPRLPVCLGVFYSSDG
jgi:hypothetical protein